MKKIRFYDIHIEKQGNPNESFDPSEYLREILDRPNVSGMFFNDGAIFSSRSSWNGARYLSVLVYCCHQVLRIYLRRFLDLFHNWLWKAGSSNVGR